MEVAHAASASFGSDPTTTHTSGDDMRQSFTLPRASVVGADSSTLMHEVADHTGSQDEAASILRSVQRLGADASIHSYEVTPTTVQRAYRGASPVIWSVRAVRR